MFSAFSAWGMLEFSSAPPRAQSIYNSIASMNGGNFDDTFSGPMCAEWYAMAMAAGAVRDTLERAENQGDPQTVHELLPVQEHMYELAPGPTDSVNTRRASLAARYLVALEPNVQNVTQALRVLLGTDFVAWVPNSTASPSPAAIPTAMCKSPYARIKTIVLRTAVSDTSRVVSIPYLPGLGDSADLFDGDTVVIDPGSTSLQEVITVHGTPNGWLNVQFANTHEAGTIGTVGAFPNWSSFKKNSLVVVKNGRASDPILRAKACDLLARMLSGTSTWDIVQENVTPGSAGPFRVEQPSIGTVPIGTKTYVSL
jgi:hypothetical protein